LEPSYQLVDHFNDCWDKNQLVIPSWDFCTKRSQELSHVKRDLYWKMDSSSGFLKVSEQAVPQRAEWQDLLQLRYLLQRMGLALDLANLMTFEKHELIRYSLASPASRLQATGPPPWISSTWLGPKSSKIGQRISRWRSPTHGWHTPIGERTRGPPPGPGHRFDDAATPFGSGRSQGAISKQRHQRSSTISAAVQGEPEQGEEGH
jgi:hypothetical protein